jgi:hypothetical protein
VETLKDDQKFVLTAEFRDSQEQIVTDGIPEWTSSDDSVVHVANVVPPDETGRHVLAIAGAPGLATVTAHLGSVTLSIDIDVDTGEATHGTLSAGTPEPK